MRVGRGSRVTAVLHSAVARRGIVRLLGGAVLLSTVGPGRAQAQTRTTPALGVVHFPVSCTADVQADFERGVALLHHMTYPTAREAFAAVAARDPRCAMAQWGIAMTLFQPLWPTRPDSAALHQGWDAVQRAAALQAGTRREALFIAAATAFFLDPDGSDYWLRIRRWAQAQATVHDSFPDDPEVTAFYALSVLAGAPTGGLARAESDRIAALLIEVYDANPGHPGAMHYLVHTNDAAGRAREALDVTEKYESVAPRNPHALHMPTHIYTRLGEWDRVIQGNRAAAAAALEHPAGPQATLVWDEFPHAIEYLVYAHLQKGEDDRAAAEFARLRGTPSIEPTFKTAFHMASIPARYALERRAWSEAAALEPRTPAGLDWDRFAWPEGIAWFARGLGAAHLRDPARADTALAALADLETKMERVGEDLFARNLRVLRLELGAWADHARGDEDSALARMSAALALEESTPKHAVTPAPTLPAGELLGDLLLELGQPGRALEAYRRTLASYPKRFNALLGAARAAGALGDRETARAYYAELVRLGVTGTRMDVLDEARGYLGRDAPDAPLDRGGRVPAGIRPIPVRGRRGPRPRAGGSADRRTPA